MKTLLIAGLLVLALASCGKNGSEPVRDTARTPANYDPCEELRKTDPHCGWKARWEHLGPSVSAIDGTKTEFLVMESKDPDGADGDELHYARLVICFENAKLCSKKHEVGVDISVHGMVKSMGYDDEYSTPVRLKFDDEKPTSQTWGIVDSHDALMPYGKEKPFLEQILRHKTLVVEFSYYERAPRTLTFELVGLADKMKSIGVAVG
jgi:hypothetical protein